MDLGQIPENNMNISGLWSCSPTFEERRCVARLLTQT